MTETAGNRRLLPLAFGRYRPVIDRHGAHRFIPCSSKHEGDTHPELFDGLDGAGTLASFAGLQQERGALPGMKRAAFMFLDGTWHLAWWTDGESVFRTRWFDEHMPDPGGILGRPLLGTDMDVQPPNDRGD